METMTVNQGKKAWIGLTRMSRRTDTGNFPEIFRTLAFYTGADTTLSPLDQVFFPYERPERIAGRLKKKIERLERRFLAIRGRGQLP